MPVRIKSLERVSPRLKYTACSVHFGNLEKFGTFITFGDLVLMPGTAVGLPSESGARERLSPCNIGGVFADVLEVRIYAEQSAAEAIRPAIIITPLNII